MPSDYDSTEFVDSDFRSSTKGSYSANPGAIHAATGSPAPSAPASRPPSREEVDSRVSETHQKLAELKRVQEELERERATLEETRRRQSEYSTGRKESLEQITRAVGLLEESEFALRQDAEQMAKSLAALRAALEKIESTNEQSWTGENFSIELTRALTILENARMELNTAKLKFPILTGQAGSAMASPASPGKPAAFNLTN